MAGSNEGNEGNEGNAGNAGSLGRGGGFSVLPDRVDLPFVTLGRIADRRLPGAQWRERDWAGDKAAMLTLADFAQLGPKRPLLYERPTSPAIKVTKFPLNMAGRVNALSVEPIYWQVGDYTLRCTDAPPNGPYAFALRNPQGNLLLRFSIDGTPVTVARGGITFTLNAAGPPFKEGHTFNITVSIGQTELWVEPPFAFRARLPGAVSVTARTSNVDNGICQATATLPGAQVGDYRLVCTDVTTTANPIATFALFGPDGAEVSAAPFPPYTLQNTQGQMLAIANEVQCVVTVGRTAFAKNDEFILAVAPRTDRLVITPKPGGNVGKGRCTANLKAGTYQLRCKTAATTTGTIFTTGATFDVLDPDGNAVPGSSFSLSAGAATSSDTTPAEPFVTITDGDPTQNATLFVPGQGFDIVVDKASPNVAVERFPASPTWTGDCTLIRPDVGTYALRCTSAAAVNSSSGTFTTHAAFSLFSPEGLLLSTITLTGSGSTSSYRSTSPPGFTITDGDPTKPATLFQVGDGFDLDVGGFLNLELDDLVRAAEDERADALGEIVAQNDGFISYFLAAMTISPKSHPRTCQLLQIGSIVGSYAVMHFKGVYQRARPSQVAPALLPPVPVPGHPAYPSGHSTQAHLMALCALAGMPDPVAREFRPVLMALAERIARNREIAGLHYPSDSAAGANLAGQIVAILGSDTMPQTLPPAGGKPKRRFQRIAEEAQDEWK